MKRLLTAALLLSLTTLGLACKDEGGNVTPGASAGGTVKVVYIPKNTGNPYFDPAIEGMRKAAEEMGATFESIAPATADSTSQLPLIKSQVQQGVNVLAISPNSPDALSPALKQAMDRGVTVITIDADIADPASRHAAVLTADPTMVGEGQVELLGSLIGYEGKFAILSATTDAPNQNQWIAEMEKILKYKKYQGMELVEIAYGNDEPQKSLSEAEALLSKYPDLKGIIAPTTVGIAAAAQAVESANKYDQVKVTGLGTPNQMRRFVKDGIVEAFQLWSPYDEGYLAGVVGIKMANGELDASAGTSFEAGTLGSRDIRDNAVIITGPPVTFNKDNIDDFDF